MISSGILLLLLPSAALAFSSTPPPEYSTSVYFDQAAAGERLDQDAYESPKFWKDIDELLPGWRSKPEYERFRGFCTNLQKEKPGRQTWMPNGQQLLAQYVFPGLDDSPETPRAAYPAEHYKELRTLKQNLEQKVAPVARRELKKLLENRPLVSDEEEFAADENDGDTWQRAAWYGWQFLSMRGAKRFMPKTTAALKSAMRDIGPAHRFVGLARQKEQCTGVEHSDHRNYMLSTLTPVSCPEENCGIIVNKESATFTTGGPAIILDNTFPHHVYNNADQDRFCLMAECWHPALTAIERDALATLFAAKDRFTVVELQMAPWGYDDDDLAAALKTGAVHDLDFWKEIGYNVEAPPQKTFVSSKKSKKKGFGKNKARGFGK